VPVSGLSIRRGSFPAGRESTVLSRNDASSWTGTDTSGTESGPNHGRKHVTAKATGASASGSTQSQSGVDSATARTDSQGLRCPSASPRRTSASGRRRPAGHPQSGCRPVHPILGELKILEGCRPGQKMRPRGFVPDRSQPEHSFPIRR